MYSHEASSISQVSTPLERAASAAAPAGVVYASVWKIWLPVIAAFVLLDATFNLYFWRIPKLSKANADYGYQFVVDALPLWQAGAKNSTRVLAFGSSISLSFDPRQVQSLLSAARPHEAFDVHRLLLPGVHPSDYVLYFEGQKMPRTPDVVVVPVNLVDFLYENTERAVNPTLRFILPPWKVLAERRDHMSTTSELDAGLSGVSRLYRYRKLIRSSVHDHLRAALRWLRRTPPSSPYGIDPDGYTQQSFAVPTTAGAATTLKYFIDPEWIRQRGQVRLEFSTPGGVLATRVEDEPGWKTVTLEIPASSGKLLEVRADSMWSARVSDLAGEPRLRGVRLADPPAVPERSPRGTADYRLWQEGEIDDFLRMGGKTGDEFAREWEALLNGDTRFSHRFRVYRDAKLDLCKGPFRAAVDYEAVATLVDLFRARGAQVIVINSPESPRILEMYRDTPYYQGYLEFFRNLAATSPGVRFYDWSAALPAEDFNDWHHPNFIGSIKLGQRYSQVIEEALPVAAQARH